MAADFFVAEFSFNSCNAGGGGYTYRMLLPSVKLLNDIIGAIIQFGYHAGCACNIVEAWLGHVGENLYDFDGNQVQVFVDGSPTFLLNASDIISDTVAISLSKSKGVLFSWYQAADGHQGISYTSQGDPVYDLYYKSGNLAGNDSFAGCGVSSKTNLISLVDKITGSLPYKLSGTVKLKGSPVVRTVRSYIRSTGAFFDEAVSLEDGTFTVYAPDTTTEMFVIALDDDAGDQYNALIYDRVKGIAV